jgi:hypothetical protein
MVLATWTFRKGDQQLILERRETAEGHSLAMIGPGRTHITVCEDLAALMVFLNDAEEFLVRTGWHLANFSPEQRQYGERRSFPRDSRERRRWWTDSLSTAIRSRQ